MCAKANHVRESRDGLEGGGHRASGASLVAVMTALYFDVPRAAGLGRGQAARQSRRGVEPGMRNRVRRPVARGMTLLYTGAPS
jgi:pyruvate dehydrogenase complex dehydrogenase (E1) component